MWLDVLFVDQPVQHRTGAVGGITDQVSGLYTELILNSIEHRLRGVGLFDAVRSRGLYVHDDAGLHIDKVVGRVCEVSRASRRCGPASGRIGQGDVLRGRTGGMCLSRSNE